MAVAARREESVQVRTRVWPRGTKTQPLAFRCPLEVHDAVMEAASGDKTAGALRLLVLAMDAQKELGDLWVQVEVRAVQENITEGEALGRIAREALEKKGRR